MFLFMIQKSFVTDSDDIVRHLDGNAVIADEYMRRSLGGYGTIIGSFWPLVFAHCCVPSMSVLWDVRGV